MRTRRLFVFLFLLVVIPSFLVFAGGKQEPAAPAAAGAEPVFAPEVLKDYGTGNHTRFAAGGGELKLKSVTDMPVFPKAKKKYRSASRTTSLSTIAARS